MYIDKNCTYLMTQEDRNGEIAIWGCGLMRGDQDHEGNCGKYPCPLGKEKPNQQEKSDDVT